MPIAQKKTVTVGDIIWTVHSRNERSCVVEGRFWFAVRCPRGNKGWLISEMGADLAHAKSASELGVIRGSFPTHGLNGAIKLAIKEPIYLAANWFEASKGVPNAQA